MKKLGIVDLLTGIDGMRRNKSDHKHNYATTESNTRSARRAVLRGVGAIAGLVTGGTLTATAETDETCGDCGYGCKEYESVDCGEVICGDCDSERDSHTDMRKHEHDKCDECDSQERQSETQVGMITIENQTSCTRKVEVQVSGVIARDPDPEHEGDETIQSIHVAGNDWVRYWFTGSIRRLDCEPADLNIEIEQRSVLESNRKKCREPLNQ